MTPRERLELAGRNLRWLRAGRSIATSAHGLPPSPFNDIWVSLVDAVEMIDRVPDREKGWLTSGKRAQVFGFATTREDVQLLEFLLHTIGESTFSQIETKVDLVADDHERMLDVLAWLRYCDRARQPVVFKKAIVELARGRSSEAVRTLIGERDLSRQAVYQMKVRAVNFIREGLERDFGIYPIGEEWRCDGVPDEFRG